MESIREWEYSSLRETLGKTLVELGGIHDKLVLVNADLVNSVKSIYFKSTYPDRCIEVGIAEQNMIGVASGLSTMGFIPVALTFGVFASKRCAEQISLTAAFPRNNVKIVGAYSGLFVGRTGASQQAIDDVAIMRAMPNMTVIDTADVVEVRAVLHYAIQHQGPVYIRVGRDEWPVVFDDNYKFELGKGQWLHTGDDVVLMSSGTLLPFVLEARDLLRAEGIDAAVVNMPSVKPIDKSLIIQAAREVGAIVTAENHNIYGGFGSAVAEVLVEHEPVPMQRVGIQDTYGESAPNEELAEKYGLTAPYIAEAARKVLARKRTR